MVIRSGSSSSENQFQSIERAFLILQLFLEKKEISTTDIRKKLGLPQSTVFRFLTSLHITGFLEKNTENNKYRLGIFCLELGNAYLNNLDLNQITQKHLEDLRDRTGETVHFAILNSNQVVYIEKLPGLHPIGLMSSRIGGRAPAYCTGIGKVLIANIQSDELQTYLSSEKFFTYTPNTIKDQISLVHELEIIRSQGYGIDNQEHEIGVACIAAPVFNYDGLFGAISISGPVNRVLDESSVGNIIDAVKSSAKSISLKLGKKK